MVELAPLDRVEKYRELHHRVVDLIVGPTGVAHEYPVATFGQFYARAQARTASGLDPAIFHVRHPLPFVARGSLYGATRNAKIARPLTDS